MLSTEFKKGFNNTESLLVYEKWKLLKKNLVVK